MKRKLSIILIISIYCFSLIAVNIVPLPHYFKNTGKYYQLEKGIDYEKVLTEGEYSQIKTLHIGIKGQDSRFDDYCAKQGFFKKEIGDEGYELLVTNGKIVLSANTPQGIFYGKQSLIQLVRNTENNRIPGVHIIDKPTLKYRGVMDDISRGPVPSKEYMKYQLRRMAELKLNMLCYYTEHIAKTEKHPEFAPPAGNISIDEWKEISQYAKEHYIELIPNFQSLGHAEKVLKNPKYRHLAESPGMYSPVKPETIRFMKDVYDEMCPAFASGFFHVNCDETFDLGKGPSKPMADSIGIPRLYANYMNELSSILSNNNKRMMMWGDIVLKHPEILKLLPSNTVMMTWEYSDFDSYAPWIDPFVESGFDFIVCPGVLNSSRLFPDYKQALPNIRKFIKQGLEKGAMGVLNTVWDEGGLHTFDQDWYGVSYGAEHSWNPNDNSLDDFENRLSAGIYQSRGKELIKAIHKLTEMAEIEALGRMNEIVYWKTIIPERGKYISYSLSDWDDVYQLCLEVDSILADKTAHNYKREYAALQIVSDEYKYLSQAKLKLAEASDLYSKACFIQYTDPGETRQLLGKVMSYVTNCRDALNKVKLNYDAIWKNENRDYWNDFEMDPFNKVISDYDDIITSLTRSINYFETKEPLLPPADIRLDIRELSGSYFTYWLISPPFAQDEKTGFDTDFLQKMGGEKDASPFPGFSFYDENGKNIKWIKFSSSYSDRVALNEELDAHEKAVSYAFCTLESPEEKEVLASVGSSGTIEIFCNGISVYKGSGSKNLIIDEYQVPLKLKSGKNRILLKIEKNSTDWDFSFKLKDVSIGSSKNKYKIR